ncbi:MAG TPA: serine/threonine-protein kinase, partial [Gemmata sp.]|nr:serine/threonine-protein kinase [Gemmata sp.]
LLSGVWEKLAIGPYRLLAPLGRGGMGTVYLARDVRLSEELGDDVLLALKILPPSAARDEPRLIARFQREIDIGKRINHPNIARTLAGGEADGIYYLAIEYVPGRSLRELVRDGGRLAVGEAARVFADVAAGLAHMHERGLIHRDLKPANVMVTPEGHGKVLDFGLAYSPGEPLPEDHTIVGSNRYIVGTMDYISPEQAQNAIAVDARSDVYSLGCSIYFSITGTPPFPGGSSLDKIRRQRKLKPVALSELNEAVPRKFAKLVERMMAKDPAERPATANEARELLLPYATPPLSLAMRSVRDTVGAIDNPSANPDLWSDGVETPEPAPSTPGAPTAWPKWALPAAIAVAVVALIAILIAVIRLLS